MDKFRKRDWVMSLGWSIQLPKANRGLGRGSGVGRFLQLYKN